MKNDVAKAHAWWAVMQRDKQDDRAALARLRRAGTILEVCMVPATMELCRSLDGHRADLGKVALLAGTLAYVNDTASERLARQLGAPADRPLMSPLRFQRLITATTPDEQLTAFRRAIIQNDRKTNVHDLVESVLHWNDERRQRWLYDYYQSRDPKDEKETTP